MNLDMPRADLLLDLNQRVAPPHAAVLVVDMQNDFCAEGGYVERIVKKDATACRKVAGPINALVAAARGAKVPVIWLRADYDPKGLPASMQARAIEQRLADPCCIPGTWGYDWFQVQPKSDEPLVDKRCYDGFVGTTLEAELRRRGVRTIVFAGVQTNVCVEATLRHAHALGFYCVVPQDCVASHTQPAHEGTLNLVRFLLGDVTSGADLARIWGASPAA
jgi:nicotinamidase-related amidase